MDDEARIILQENVLGTIATINEDGSPWSSPVHVFSDDEAVYWFSHEASQHSVNVEKDPRVSVAYASPSTNTYVSVSGVAQVVNDREKIEELWNPIYKAWFPKGLDDPTICLLKVSVEQAEYWDSPSSTLVQIVGFVKAMVTGQQADGGDHGKVTL